MGGGAGATRRRCARRDPVDRRSVGSFDEASRNFEFVNSSGQGLGGDAIDVRTLLNFQNGQYVHAPDGSAPEIRTGRWQTPYDVRGSDSALLVYHEYTHGLVHRLVGAGSGSVSGVHGKALSEGWADWYALDLVVDEGRQRSRRSMTPPRGTGNGAFEARALPISATHALDRRPANHY